MNEEQKIAELMKPRILVADKWPGMECKVGDIINLPSEDWKYDKYNYCESEYFDTWPNLFRKLQWWEEREPGIMPEYVKADDGQIYKIKDWDNFSAPYVFVDPSIHKGYMDHCYYSVLYGDHLPATRAEYDLFMNSKTDKQ